MADIDVVPKRRTSLWLWVVLAIAVVVILWMALANRTARRTGRIMDRPAAGAMLTAHTPRANVLAFRG
jgi:bacteriorhodopsin